MTLSPRPLAGTNRNFVNVTVEWTDPDACDSRYLVGVYHTEELRSLVRNLGFHPAPATTTVYLETGWLFENPPSRRLVGRRVLRP